MDDRILICPGGSPKPSLGGPGRGLKNSSIDIIDGMNQVLALFELPAYFREVSRQKALVEGLGDGYKLPQGFDFLLLKADERQGWVFLFHCERPFGIIGTAFWVRKRVGFPQGKGESPLDSLLSLYFLDPDIHSCKESA